MASFIGRLFPRFLLLFLSGLMLQSNKKNRYNIYSLTLAYVSGNNSHPHSRRPVFRTLQDPENGSNNRTVWKRCELKIQNFFCKKLALQIVNFAARHVPFASGIRLYLSQSHAFFMSAPQMSSAGHATNECAYRAKQELSLSMGSDSRRDREREPTGRHEKRAISWVAVIKNK